jgi:hypothetical protein
MAQITLTGAAFHGFRFTVGPKRGEGAPTVIAEFRAPWTEANRKAGGWEEVPDSVSGHISLVPTDLAASHIKFVPGKGLQQHAFSLDVSGASGLSLFVPTKEGEPRELRFVVKSANIKAGRLLDTYGRTAGAATGKLKISVDETQPTEPLIFEDQTTLGSQ